MPALHVLSNKPRSPAFSLGGRFKYADEMSSLKTPGPGLQPSVQLCIQIPCSQCATAASQPAILWKVSRTTNPSDPSVQATSAALTSLSQTAAYTPREDGKKRPPQYSMIPRRDIKHESTGPGPAAYTHDGKLRNTEGVVLKSRTHLAEAGSDSPGPGDPRTPAPAAARVLPERWAGGFRGRSGRGAPPRERAPAPRRGAHEAARGAAAAYNPVNPNHVSPCWSLTRRPEDASLKAAATTPGPSSYDVKVFPTRTIPRTVPHLPPLPILHPRALDPKPPRCAQQDAQ
jgi:hypothetical protein